MHYVNLVNVSIKANGITSKISTSLVTPVILLVSTKPVLSSTRRLFGSRWFTFSPGITQIKFSSEGFIIKIKF